MTLLPSDRCQLCTIFHSRFYVLSLFVPVPRVETVNRSTDRNKIPVQINAENSRSWLPKLILISFSVTGWYWQTSGAGSVKSDDLATCWSVGGNAITAGNTRWEMWLCIFGEYFYRFIRGVEVFGFIAHHPNNSEKSRKRNHTVIQGYCKPNGFGSGEWLQGRSDNKYPLLSLTVIAWQWILIQKTTLFKRISWHVTAFSRELKSCVNVHRAIRVKRLPDCYWFPVLSAWWHRNRC